MSEKQTKGKSLLESIVNTAVGYAVTVIFSPLIYWICDVKVNFTQINLITILFTFLSIGRNYVVRRWFNKIS
jgi:hypothetical protein